MRLNPHTTQAVIFDMDGVLFNSSDCHARAFNKVLHTQGITDFSYLTVAGMRTDEAFEKIFAQRGRVLPNALLAELIRRKRSIAAELLESEGGVIVGATELIDSLRPTHKLALASSASPGTVELFLKRSGFASSFTTVLSGSDVIHAKPDPEIYTLARTQLGLPPEACVVIEDAENGVLAAVRAEIPVIAVVDRQEEKRFLELGAAAVVSDLGSIGQLLNTQEVYAGAVSE